MHIMPGKLGMGFFGHVSLKDELQEKSQGVSSHELTREKVAEMLEEIELECKVGAFLSKPLVAFSVAAGDVIIGLALMETASVIVAVAGIIILVGGMIAGLVSFFEICDGSMSERHDVYTGVGKEAHELRMNMLANPREVIHFHFER